MLYSIGIYIYGFLVTVASLFNDKAQKLSRGQRKALRKLKNKVRPNADYIWIHAASLGEFEQGRPLIEFFNQNHPENPILLTFYSPSGYEVKKNYKNAEIVSYLPLDTPYAAKQFLQIVKPSKAIFIKYEFWPNFLSALNEANVPTFLISAIFRPDQLFFKSYGKWYRNLLKTYEHIFVQDQDSLELLNKYGIDQASIAGDSRFDRVISQAENPKKFPLIEKFIDNKPVIIAGSTWEKDEVLLTRYSNEHPDIKMIIVPHEVHKAHLYDIFKMLQGDYVRYSEATIDSVKNSNCLVLDTIGMLSSVYQYATVAYIGGGFGAGIHNILEAAVYGVPVIFGPNYKKFREAREMINTGGAFSISNYEELSHKLDLFLNNPEEAGKRAGEYVQNNAGATEEILKYIIK
ncbi:3-deoxy-D-manno-octulosonic acid transferase [Paludibacteraceae bacterium OttesenSCG-928-F17]|nr:3-deoxy-D-manno-octulosonic acid transferase [Paludibacteraceae bacterium OttesenSCG-928-F17]